MDGDKLTATGGRVLGITARAANVRDAQKLAYQAVDAIDWEDGFCRRDIGWRAIAREQG
jgi:phosphoribosylamine--glycine ligase